MCIIFSCYEGVPDKHDLRAAAEGNPHGAGIAWVQDGRVQWRKGIQGKPDYVAKEIGKLIEGKPLPLLIHFRVATVGGPIPELTHPFPIVGKVPLALQGSANQVLMHNGHWTDWVKDSLETRSLMIQGAMREKGGGLVNVKIPQGPWSDSRAMAWNASIYGEGFLTLRVPTQKIAILDSKGGVRYWNLKDWYEDKKGGFYHSASIWKAKVTDNRGKNFRYTRSELEDIDASFWTEVHRGDGFKSDEVRGLIGEGKIKVVPPIPAKEAPSGESTKSVGLADGQRLLSLADPGLIFTQEEVEFELQNLLAEGRKVELRT